MHILGLQKTTLLDYPGHVAATIFTGGCNMRCPFCHNMNIAAYPVLGNSYSTDTAGVSDNNPVYIYTIEEVLEFLASRSKLLDGVCITGGEPTLNPDLPDFIKAIKELGLKIKLDTNGTNPTMIKSLVHDGLLDYIAMDIKSSLETYGKVCGIDNINTDNILSSIDFLLEGNVNYEFRTTIIREYHDLATIESIGQMLKGADNYYLQSFIDSEYVPNHNLSSCDKATLLTYSELLSNYINNVNLRGIN